MKLIIVSKLRFFPPSLSTGTLSFHRYPLFPPVPSLCTGILSSQWHPLFPPALPAHDNQVGTTSHHLTPVTSGQLRELTARMIIPSSRIRLLDTLGHGKDCSTLCTVNIHLGLFSQLLFLYIAASDCGLAMYLKL